MPIKEEKKEEKKPKRPRIKPGKITTQGSCRNVRVLHPYGVNKNSKQSKAQDDLFD